MKRGFAGITGAVLLTALVASAGTVPPSSAQEASDYSNVIPRAPGQYMSPHQQQWFRRNKSVTPAQQLRDSRMEAKRQQDANRSLPYGPGSGRPSWQNPMVPRTQSGNNGAAAPPGSYGPDRVADLRRQFEALKAEAQSHYNVGNRNLGDQTLNQAVPVLEKLSVSEPDNPDWSYIIGGIKLFASRSPRIDEARKWYQRCLKTTGGSQATRDQAREKLASLDRVDKMVADSRMAAEQQRRDFINRINKNVIEGRTKPWTPSTALPPKDYTPPSDFDSPAQRAWRSGDADAMSRFHKGIPTADDLFRYGR